MSMINLFLQKRKMHESQYGFVMVFIAYALSVMMLFVGSDLFYNINSTAAGVSTTDEETIEKMKKEMPDLKAAEITAILMQSKELYPFAIAEISEVGLGRIQAKVESTDNSAKEPEVRKEALLLRNEFSGLNPDGGMEIALEPESVSGIVASPEGLLLGDMATQETKAEKAAQVKDNTDTAKDTAKVADKKEIYSMSAEEDATDYVYDVTEEEIGMLQRIVQAEAGGEDMIGKILIVNVVMNRIADKSFPDTVEKVIFQNKDGEYQFSPVDDKSYWSVKVSKKTKEAVVRALEGEDYSKGALYFIARKRTKSSSAEWFDNNLEWLFKHGGHEFYKER
jgi:N-acetylmuramoyl-L-alanine amidase